MLLAVCADKGSPGATTTGLALASVWRSPTVLVEADPYGGDLAIRMRTKAAAAMPEAPTVLTVATAARSSESSTLVARYAQQINQQLAVVPGHLVAEQLSGVPDWNPFAASLGASSSPVVADLGRLHAASPVLPVASRADVVLVVARPEAGAVIRLRERLNRLVPVLASHRGAPPRILPVLVSAARHGAADVADLNQVLSETAAGPLLVGVGFVALDPGSVARLMAGEDPAGRLARAPLLRSARKLAAAIEDLLEARVASRSTGSVAWAGSVDDVHPDEERR